MVTVKLLVSVDDWELAYGVDLDEMPDDVRGSLNQYKESDSVFVGASDAPFKLHSVGAIKLVSTY